MRFATALRRLLRKYLLGMGNGHWIDVDTQRRWASITS